MKDAFNIITVYGYEGDDILNAAIETMQTLIYDIRYIQNTMVDFMIILVHVLVYYIKSIMFHFYCVYTFSITKKQMGDNILYLRSKYLSENGNSFEPHSKSDENML